jgi:hypothetical protein
MRAIVTISSCSRQEADTNLASYVELGHWQTTISVCQSLDRHDDENQRDGYHQKAE